MRENNSSKFVDLLPTNIEGVKLFPPLPIGFDHLTASPESLIAHGIMLPRPDAKSNPHGLAKWIRMVGPPPRTAQEADRQRAHLLDVGRRLEPQVGLTHHRRGARGSEEGVSSWNGASSTPPQGATWTGATAMITVPSFVTRAVDYNPNPFSGGFDASIWVGLDGGPGSQTGNDVLQAGFSVHVDSVTSAVSFVAWFEWYVEPPWLNQQGQVSYVYQVNLPTPVLPVNPGDQIWVLVGYGTGENSNTGYVFIGNMTPATYTPVFGFALNLPNGADAVGATAEWIVEAPKLKNGSIAVLPDFFNVYFNSCYANTG
jgi:Peptidase A4 family